jgi:hypothetical protein
MRTRKAVEVLDLQESGRRGGSQRVQALSAHLMARIARRPGRWRRKMQPNYLRDEAGIFEWDDAA